MYQRIGNQGTYAVHFSRICDSGAAPLPRNPRTKTWVGRSSQPNLRCTCQVMGVHLYNLQCTEDGTYVLYEAIRNKLSKSSEVGR